MATQFPDDFKCPSSLEIMSDPVILSSGHTFDRSSIQRWLDSGNRTCPLSKLPIHPDLPLIPNHALRSLISNFTLTSQSNPEPKPQSHPLVSTLSSPFSPLHSRLDSLHQLNRFSQRNPVYRQLITESGAVSAVLNFVSSDDVTVQEAALELLLNLSLDDDSKVGLVAEGAIGHVVKALLVGNPNCRALAATILTSLALLQVNKATIGAYPSAIRALVLLLRDGSSRESKEAATALCVLCSFSDNKKRAVECGVVPILIQMANSGIERALEVLSLLAKCSEARYEMVKCNGCVPILVRVLKNGNSRGVQHALSSLNSICSCSKDMGSVARREGAVHSCLGLLKHESETVRRNASNLIQTLGR